MLFGVGGRWCVFVSGVGEFGVRTGCSLAGGLSLTVAKAGAGMGTGRGTGDGGRRISSTKFELKRAQPSICRG